MELSELTDRFLGSMLGSALGDAIGELAFSIPDRSDLLDTVEASSRLNYTDDTAMAIGIAQEILEHGTIDTQRLGARFHENYNLEPWRGYALGPPTLFAQAAWKGISYTDAAKDLFGGEGSFGNGAAMRIGPVGMFYHASPDLDPVARASAAATHVHPVGIDGGAVQAAAVGQALRHDRDQPIEAGAFCRALLKVARTEEIRNGINLVQRQIEERAEPHDANLKIGRGIAVHESMPFSLFAFLTNHSSFEECLLCAVLHGGDADTLGAMACAISGAYLGVGAIPEDWLEKLENRSMLEDLARGLAEQYVQQATNP